MDTHHRLPDTRPYPTDAVKNELLIHARHLTESTSKAQTTLAQESLHSSIAQMLAQNHYTALSVALSMASTASIYNTLWQSLIEVLQAQKSSEVQWLALPVIVVGGSQQYIVLPADIPADAISHVFRQQSWIDAWKSITWAKQLIDADTLTDIKASQWFKAKQSMTKAQQLLDALATPALTLASGQSVQVFYALGFADSSIQPALGAPLGAMALPLMQVWQEKLAVKGATLFTNPLPPLPPLAAMHEGNAMRLRMACDVFTANAIRAIRLQSPRVGVVIATTAHGQLLFGFNATDSAFELQQQVFTWPLTPADDLDVIVQNFIDLLAECQVENIRLLHEPVDNISLLPNYARAINMAGHNPLFNMSH
ncbi:conjugal transfer protein [Neisseriaceae bacterium ESL0693]|nr:conjugal transfer protein [Neisseriaceae bacterium ESL0693]